MFCKNEMLKDIKGFLTIGRVFFYYIGIIIIHIVIYRYYTIYLVVCPYLWCLVILRKSIKCFLDFVLIVLFIFNANNFPQEMTKEFCSFQVSSLYVFRYLELRYF